MGKAASKLPGAQRRQAARRKGAAFLRHVRVDRGRQCAAIILRRVWNIAEGVLVERAGTGDAFPNRVLVIAQCPSISGTARAITAIVDPEMIELGDDLRKAIVDHRLATGFVGALLPVGRSVLSRFLTLPPTRVLWLYCARTN